MPDFDFGSLIDKPKKTPKQPKERKKKEMIVFKSFSPHDLDSYPMSRLRAFHNILYGRDPPHNKEWDKDKVRNAIIDFFEKL